MGQDHTALIGMGVRSGKPRERPGRGPATGTLTALLIAHTSAMVPAQWYRICLLAYIHLIGGQAAGELASVPNGSSTTWRIGDTLGTTPSRLSG